MAFVNIFSMCSPRMFSERFSSVKQLAAFGTAVFRRKVSGYVFYEAAFVPFGRVAVVTVQ